MPEPLEDLARYRGEQHYLETFHSSVYGMQVGEIDMNPSQRRKEGWAELHRFRHDEDGTPSYRAELMDSADRRYNGPVWGYDDAFGSLFDLGFMAGWQACVEELRKAGKLET